MEFYSVLAESRAYRMSESLIRRNAEGLTQNTIANMVTPYINPIVTGMVVWVLTKVETISGWSAGWKIALIISVAVGLTFLLHTLPSLFRRRNSPDQPSSAPAVSESTRLIELRDDLDVMKRERDTAQAYLKTCEGEQEQTLKRLNECQSLRRLEAGEVDRVTKHYTDQLDTARQQYAESNDRVSELEQQLRVAQDKLDTFTVPAGSLRIKKALWRAWTDEGQEFNLDLKEFFEDTYVENDKLIIPKGLYRKMFSRDPLVGKEKILEIEFTHGGRKFFVVLPENISVTLPFPYSETTERMS